MKICFAASEMVPFAKTGGLADAVEGLTKQLHQATQDIRPFIPLYSTIDRSAIDLTPVDVLQDVRIDLGRQSVMFSVWASHSSSIDPAVYFVDCPSFFDRPSIYTNDEDEAHRFTFFSRAVIECCQRMGWSPDIFHCHDWHTAMLPFLLRSMYGWDKLFRDSRTLLTIHNIGNQGHFADSVVDQLGLCQWAHMLDQRDLDEGSINFLRAGLTYANAVSTISPTYAEEIQTDEYGMGLQDVIRCRSGSVFGILNGVDYSRWSPELDQLIPHKFGAANLTGKRRNKRQLLESCNLSVDLDTPLIGIVSRLTAQKGFDLCMPVLPSLLEAKNFALFVLGTGEHRYEEFFNHLQFRFPKRVFFYRGYSDELAHLITAGSDMFLMPSVYEPCGINQMFSLKYGTVPIVRSTGGLADSVEQFDPPSSRGTGFVFERIAADDLQSALERAFCEYRDATNWKRLVANAMAVDHSWRRRSEQYLDLYQWMAAAA